MPAARTKVAEVNKAMDIFKKVTDVIAGILYLRNLKEKYPQGYEQFKARNLNLDVSQPIAALGRARLALDALLVAAREEEWGVAVSIEL